MAIPTDKSRKIKRPGSWQGPGRFIQGRAITALVVALLAGLGLARAQAPAASPGEGGLPAAMVSSTYTLSPYDVIDVAVYNEDDLHTRARLGADGTVLLPLIQSVSLANLTVSQATDLIRKRYANGFVKDPHVLVTVLEYRKSTFSILGEINKPGIYEIPEGTHMSIVDAVLLAGGFTHTAWRNNVKIKRIVKGKAVVYTVHAGAMADSASEVPFEIKSGDVINVKESWW
jgi:polysaccharide export outer membrane protein